jgi:hypothetical protein
MLDERLERVPSRLERGEAGPDVAPRIIPSRPRRSVTMVPATTTTSAFAVSSKNPTPM